MSSDTSNKAVKAGAGYMIGNYLLKGITFLSAPIFTRLLLPSEYGDFNSYIAYETIIYILLGLALHSSLNNAKYKYEEKFEEYVSSILTLVLFSTAIWFIIGNVFFDLYSEFFGFDRLVANTLIFHCLSSSLLQVYNVYLSVNYSYKSYVKISSINAILNIIVSVLLILTVFDEDRTTGRILGTAIPIIGIGIYILVFFFRKAKPTINKEYWKFGFVYSLPIIPHGISQVVLASFDRIMIKNMVGSAESGIYSFAYTIYSLLKIAANSVENVWRPWIYEKLNQKEYDDIRKQATRIAFGMGLLTLMVCVMAPEVSVILGDKEYWGSSNCVIPVVLGGYFAFLYTIPAMVEYYYEKTKFIATGTICAAGLNIILNSIFIPMYGYIAAAYTTLGTYFAYFLFHYILAHKIQGYSLFNTKALFGISAIVVILGESVLLINDYWLLRWGIALCLVLSGLYWAEKQFGLVTKMKMKILKK